MSVQDKTPEQKAKELADARIFYGDKLFDSMSPAAREKLGNAVARLNRAIELEEQAKAENKPSKMAEMSFTLALKAEAEAFAVGSDELKKVA